MQFTKYFKKFSLLIGLFLVFSLLLTGCVNDGGREEVVESVVDNVDKLNTALNSDNIIKVLFDDDIAGNVLIDNRTSDLLIDLQGQTLDGDFEIDQPLNNIEWELTIENGTITGDFIVNDPAITVTLADGVTIEGNTHIINVSGDSFNNRGILNNVNISDNDGCNFNNQGTINGNFNINSEDSSGAVNLGGDFSGTKSINIRGRNSIIRLRANMGNSNVVTRGDNNDIEIDNPDKEDNVDISQGINNRIRIIMLDEPEFDPDPEEGPYTEEQDVEITYPDPEEEVDIYYTTDGSEPTQNSNKYESPVHVDGDITIKAKAYKDKPGKNHVSEIAKAEYIINLPTPVTGITLDKESMELPLDGTGELTATVEPDDATNKKVRWSSSDKDVVTVEDGTVTVQGVGTAYITVTTVDGNYTATCEVEVLEITAEVSGQIVDLAGNGVGNVGLSLAGEEATTADDGTFTFSDIETGDYELTGKGDTDDNWPYVVNPTDITVDPAEGDLDLGTIKSHKILGAGVVMQSISKNETAGIQSLDEKEITPDLKKIELEDIKSSTTSTFSTLSKTTSSRIGIASFDLQNEVSYIMLAWEPLQDVDNYEVYYVEENGSEEKVWDSTTVDPEVDPAYDSTEPQAYLDLGDELSGKISGAGTYRFKVVAEDETELPAVDVSFGKILESYPENINYDPDQELLTWDPVTGADNYYVNINDDNDVNIDSPELNDTSYDVSDVAASDPAVYYQTRVNAHAIDAMGWPLEITRGISGFEK